MSDPIRIPLRGRGGVVKGYALVGPEDATLAERRWYLTPQGYAASYDRDEYARTGKRRVVTMHRLIADCPVGLQVDHINRDRLDNRRPNLRVVEPRVQAQNKSSHRGSTSRHRGVSRDRRRGKWLAQVMADGRNQYLGAFDREDDAAAAVAEFRRQHVPFSQEAGA